MVEPDRRPSARTTVGGDLLWVILWSLLVGGLSLLAALDEKSGFRRGYLLAAGVVFLLLAFALYRLASWARILGAVIFGLGALVRIASIFTAGFTGSKLLFALLMGWWCVYLLLPSTRRMFESARGSRLDLPTVIMAVVVACVMTAFVFAAAAAKLPRWTHYVAMGAVVVAWMKYEGRISTFLGRRLARRPADVAVADWPAVRSATHALLDGKAAEAERLVSPLPSGFSVNLLKDLITARLSMDDPGLRRMIFDAGYQPPKELHARIRDEAWQPELRKLLDVRVRLVDGLIEDSTRDHPFVATFDETMQQLTGDVIVNNPDHQHRERWPARRGRCTGARASEWLVARLWAGDCLDAARVVAERIGDPDLLAAASLSVAIDEAANGDTSFEWWLRHRFELPLVPMFADLFASFVVGVGTGMLDDRALEVLKGRLRVVRRLRSFQEDYAEVCGIEPRWLLSHLTGYRMKLYRTHAAFEAWWLDERTRQEKHDEAVARGLHAAAEGMWEPAEREFGAAESAWPERETAGHNRAIALMNLERYEDADAVLEGLLKKRPKDTILWMHRGDCRRKAGRLRDAVEAYERAVREGGFESEVALRLGVTLAEDDQEDRAVSVFQKLLGKDPDAEDLESLANILEEQGAYRLSMRYRDEALLRGLGTKSDEEPDEDDAVGV